MFNLLTTSVALLATATVSVAQTCDLPSSYSWTDSGVLAQPKNGWASVKDFSVTNYNGKKLVYGSYNKGGNYGSMAFGLVNSWTELASASQTGQSFAAVAPTLFQFNPKN